MPEVISPTESDFLKDISGHAMEVMRDDGVYRHLYCRKPNTFDRHFFITTWPGYLCVSGDMGTWVFSRIDDMFEFFRRDGIEGRTLPINPGYWAEKLQASRCSGRNRGGGASSFDSDIFTKKVKEHMIEYMRSEMRGRHWLGRGRKGKSSSDERREMRSLIEDDVLSRCDDGEDIAIHAACNFEYNRHVPFDGFWETDCRAYDHSFIWCLYAIVWTIQKYDAVKSAANG